MKLRGSHLVSLAILGAIGGWMVTGNLILGGQADPNTFTIAERQEKETEEAFHVRVHKIQPLERITHLNIRGRTQADATITVRAETGGTVKSRPVKKGQKVQVGDLLCTLDKGVREKNLAQAQTQLTQLQADYASTAKLVERGFATKANLRAIKSSLDAAKASIATAQQELARTEIRSTTAGIVQTPLAQVGDNLNPGGICLTLMDNDPMIFIGQVSERDIAKVSEGMSAEINLVTQEKVQGEIRYISPVADPQTRTFTVEISLPNPQQNIRDGLTASATITLAPTMAYQVEASWLVLNDEGEIGLRSVNPDNKVFFHPVTILSQGEQSVWVNGLEANLNIITLGQNYVARGETVKPVTAEELKAIENQSIKTPPSTASTKGTSS